jgi:hypothetical protein
MIAFLERRCLVVIVATPPKGEQEFVDLAQSRLRSLLPEGWRVGPPSRRQRRGDQGFDAVLSVDAPDGASIGLILEIKRSVVGRDVETLSNRIRRATDRWTSDAVPMVVSTFLSEPVRQALIARGVSYLDATGNLYLKSRRPALFLRDVGADRDPWRARGRPRGSLRGEPAALVARALVDFRPPYSVPELVRLSGSSNGATYRVVDFLEEQALLRRDEKGRVADVSWRALLELWSRDYSFYESNPVTGYLAPRGIERVVEALRASEPAAGADDPRGATPARYVITGSFAAGAYAPYAPTKLLTIYADSRDAVSTMLDLRRVDAGANVMIAQASYDAVFARRQPWQGVWVTAPSQTAVDLMTGPGRNPAEAQEMLDWMEGNESVWRRGPS